ncbi:hypothetical protein C1645_878103 [Glomus cerebriforme]|uniref:BTB domain-containing protein n=1 Tax=Glomus cerebriforme TaxID=658196 RepID=A0A397STP5_9GLOM|nr:hypothetical protein C1645_878103 [Glomus cerebriforme]
MVDNKLLQKLSQNLLEILDDDEYYDITIEVGNDPYVKIFRAHMVILNYRSPYLRRILSTNKKKNDETLINIKLPNISPETFNVILRYIYGGKLSLKEFDDLDIFKILIAANELSLQELISHLQSFLIKNKLSWMEQNFNLVYQTSFEIDSFSDLQKFCTEFITVKPHKIFNSSDFTSISENILISIIRHDNLQMSQVQVWEHVLKWGIAQNPELSSDPSSYSNEDFNTLKNTLKKCIPFMKFTKFTSKEFLNKVYPYKNIIPEELCDNLIKYFLDHDCSSYNIAVEKENSIALNTLGNLYENGEDVDLEKAIYWYSKAAEIGNDEAQYNLGRCYRFGIGVEKNEAKAFEYYKLSADQEYLNAQFQLGYCYDYGIGTGINKVKALELYRIAAEKGHIDAQKGLGILCKNKGIEKFIETYLEKVIYWYNNAAENGDNAAQYNLGWCHRFGVGVEKNEVKGFEYYKKSADQGYLNAQFSLGYLYDQGIGTEVNEAKAFEYYKIAAEKGHIFAQNNLGCLYKDGKGVVGVEKNEIKAFEYFKKSANQGYLNAQFNLDVVMKMELELRLI